MKEGDDLRLILKFGGLLKDEQTGEPMRITSIDNIWYPFGDENYAIRVQLTVQLGKVKKKDIETSDEKGAQIVV